MSEKQMIIPFGKYAGQPVDVLQADPSYCQWLTGQNWFRERYATINTLIINNFTKPEDTPEHNALQVKFLDNDFVEKFGKYYFKINDASRMALAKKYSEQYAVCTKMYNKEQIAIDEYNKNTLCDYPYTIPKDAARVPCNMQHGDAYYYPKCKELYDAKSNWWCKPGSECVCCKLSDMSSKVGLYKFSHIEFEVDGWDVKFVHGVIGQNNSLDTVYIEIKPCVGDDYPSILRQMKANQQDHYGTFILLYKQFTATGATESQVKEIFKNSKFNMISFSEIEVTK